MKKRRGGRRGKPAKSHPWKHTAFKRQQPFEVGGLDMVKPRGWMPEYRDRRSLTIGVL